MVDEWLHSGMYYRVGASVLITVAMIVWEFRSPMRSRVFSRSQRWPINFLFLIFNGICGRLLAFLSPMLVAIFCEKSGYGLLHLMGTAPWLNVVLSVIALDFCIYFQHLVFHRVEFLWRFHAMHHSDRDLDVSSGGRFHPVEIILSLLIKSFLVFLLGVSPLAVLIFEIVLNGTATFNHSNVKISRAAENILTRFVVTPKFHLSHHSVEAHHCHKNFGFNFPWWDRMFGTYDHLDDKTFDGLTIGNKGYLDDETISLPSLLSRPFRNSQVKK